MKTKNKILLIISLLLIPTIVFASGGNNDFPIGIALVIEAFVSIHMSVFVLKPLANMFSKEKKKVKVKMVKNMFLMLILERCHRLKVKWKLQN